MNKKKLLISEEKYNKDFVYLLSFWNYHVKNKQLPISLDEIQAYGVYLEVKKRNDLARLDFSAVPKNTIFFSSSKKACNVKNLTWTMRCMAAHPENIKEIKRDNNKYYKLKCSTIDRKTKEIVPTMKGLVACDLWPRFTKQLINRIKEL